MSAGRRLPFSHPFFADMSPEEYWSRRYNASMSSPEYFEGTGSFPSRASYSSHPVISPMSPPMTMGRPGFPVGNQQTSRTVQRREYTSGTTPDGFPQTLFDQHFGGDTWPSPQRGSVSPIATSSTAGGSGGAMSPLIPAYVFYTRKPGFQRQISGASEIQSDDKSYKVSLDVQQFTPDELDVRVVDGEILIHAKHEQRQDEHGFVSREFTRRYTLPEDIDPDSLKSSLSEEGILYVEAPRKLAIKEREGKELPIKVEAKPRPAVATEASSVAAVKTTPAGENK